MSRRLDLRPIIVGQWRGLSKGLPPNIKPDWLSRVIVFLGPLALLAVSLVFSWNVVAPTALLSGAALLAGGLLSAFSYLSTLRMKVTEWSEDSPERWQTERAMLDETAAHLLAAVTSCIILAVLLVAGMNTSQLPQNVFGGVLAAVCYAVGSYIVLIFLVCIPRLYNAYTELNQVSNELSGFTRGKL